MSEKMKIRFYPVGRGDSALVESDDSKFLMIDYNRPADSEDDEDERIDLKEELDEQLGKKDLDVLMITHMHDDHYNGFSDYFWLNFAAAYQGDSQKKIKELWVPDAIIWELGVKDEALTLRSEARHRLLNEKKGIKVFGESASLIKFIEGEGVKYDDVKHLIFKPGETLKHFSGFDIFVHSPHAWKSEKNVDMNSKSIIIQADFKIGGTTAAKAIFGGDAESDAWESIYSASENNTNLDKLEFDIFKVSHHCSHDALNLVEKGDLITTPVEKVRKIFEERSLDKCMLIASCEKIPTKEKRNEKGPPHYQAAEYYRKIAGEKGGKFEVTMQQAISGNSRKPIIIEITSYGPRLMSIAVGGIAAVTSTKTERFG